MNRLSSAQNVVSDLVGAMSPSTRLMASALGGDKRALERLLCYPKLSAGVEHHRVGPGLAKLAGELNVSGSCLGTFQEADRTAQQANASAAAAQVEIAGALAKAGVRWCPCVGGSLLRQILPGLNPRSTTGLRLLIAEGDLGLACRACVEVGWRPESEGPGLDSYLKEEGYVWRATNPQGLELEFFFRLWDWVPRQIGRDMLERSTLEPDLRINGCRLTPADAYLVTALRIWATPAPRPLLFWWDLHEIAENGGETLGRDVYREARYSGLQFPVGLAAAIASGLWDHACHRQVAALLEEASKWEKLAMKVARQRGPERVPTSFMALSRLMSGRQTLSGWRSMTRAIWAHPGVVKHETPEKYPSPVRRVIHVAKSLGRMVRPSG